MELINTKNNKKSFKKLGFTYLETAEIVITLKQLIANYHVYYFKTRNFHWNVEGADFFELHQEFENEYNEAKDVIDLLAERIRAFGLKPSMNLEEILKRSQIKEVKGEVTSMEMVKELLKDFDLLHNAMLDVLNSALETGDNVTEQIVTDLMRKLEKRNWMFSSWCR